MVVIKSNPRYPKNKMVDASITPDTPNSSFIKGVKFSILKFRSDTPVMKAKMNNLPDVTTLLKAPAASLPNVVIQVQKIKNNTASGDAVIE